MNKKKKVLIYAHYYAPDVASTGQILQDLAEGMNDEFLVTVICTVPSYTGKISADYRGKKFFEEKINGVRVLRVSVPEFQKNSKVSRIINLVAYFFRSIKATRLIGKQDYVFTISQPPILGGMLGLIGKYIIKQKHSMNTKFIYCIQDFNPEQIEAVGYFNNKFIINCLRKIDNVSCKKADLVITVGGDLVETLKNRFQHKNVPNHTMIHNWIDQNQIFPLNKDNECVLEFSRKYHLNDKYVIMYSGNIGLYYDLENLIKLCESCKDLRTSDNRQVVFTFVGDGAVLKDLKRYKKVHNLENVVFIPYQDKDKLIYSLNAADVHWCVNAKGIKGVSCPSKFYGICGVGKPVLGVLEKGTEIRSLIEKIGCGKCSEPGDYEGILRDIKWFVAHADGEEVKMMAQKGHEFLLNHLTKEISIKKYISAIKNC